ncbi:unnamed protein product, partial [marine sediment metagenome]
SRRAVYVGYDYGNIFCAVLKSFKIYTHFSSNT